MGKREDECQQGRVKVAWMNFAQAGRSQAIKLTRSGIRHGMCIFGTEWHRNGDLLWKQCAVVENQGSGGLGAKGGREKHGRLIVVESGNIGRQEIKAK